MKIKYGSGKTEYGPGVEITLSGDEIATAIAAYLVAKRVHAQGPRTITVNGDFCREGNIYIEASGYVIDKKGKKIDGGGPIQ